MTTRQESDSLGTVQVPADALYGAQTQRAVENFPISGSSLPEPFIRALLVVKSAAAHSNTALKSIPAEIGEAIQEAAKALLADPGLMRHFPVDVYQTGSGTSTNMNANEVLATSAAMICGLDVSPNDHVNCAQSSNDVIPTCIHVSAAIALTRDLLPAIAHLESSIREKATLVHHHIKTGRTHLMDAMPVRLSQPLIAWADQLAAASLRLENLMPELLALAQGGTAVGTGVNASDDFAQAFCYRLAAMTDLPFTVAANPFTRIGAQDVSVALSGALKALATTVMKISNDLRWMNSGPLAGFSEIELEALQPGSSIMPGKVNPVIPEAAAMVSAQVVGNDAAITVAGQSGNFELNVMLPLIAHNLLSSIESMAGVLPLLADRAIATFKVNGASLESALTRNPILVTALNPIIGYAEAARIAKLAYSEGLPIIDVAVRETAISRAELAQLLDPAGLTGSPD